MGLSDERIVNPASVSETLRCAICQEVYVDPVFSSGRPCQHVFCRACIDKALQRRQQCPSCRAPLQKKRLQPHLAIRSLLDELHINCEAGCSWTGRQDAYPAHVAACPANLLQAARRQLDEQTAELRQLRRQTSEREEEQAGKIFALRADLCEARQELAEARQDLAEARRRTELEAEARCLEVQAEAAAKAARDAQAAAEAAAKKAAEARRRARAPCGEPSAPMQIFIRTILGSTRVLAVEPQDTVDTIKHMIHSEEGLPPDTFYLTYGSKPLEDWKSMADYSISKSDTLTVRMRLLSGPCEPPSKGTATIVREGVATARSHDEEQDEEEYDEEEEDEEEDDDDWGVEADGVEGRA